MSDKESPEFFDEQTAQSLVVAETPQGIEDNKSIIGLKIGPYNAALLRRRQELRLTQGQLAQKVGFKTSASIGQIETLRSFPRPEIAKNIADALGTTPEKLFPQWLQLFTRDNKQPAQIRVELTESEIDPLVIKRAYEIETTLTAIDPQVEVEAKELREKLYDVLGSLTWREKRIAISRFGLEGKAQDLDEVGAEFNISRERVRQIEAKILRKLRHPSRKRRLEGLEDEQPGDLRNEEALINGTINALHQGDSQRALANLAEVEKKYLQYTTENEESVINNLRLSENWYKWDESTIEDWYKHQENTEDLNIDEVLEIIKKLKEVEKLRAKIQKD